jgi:hypothetical protein
MQISVTFRVDLPDFSFPLSHAEIQDWLEFNLGAVSELRHSPISSIDIEANRHSVSYSVVD